jgi:stearoyl-CoA desaturase (delta-9 desaturase)
MTAILSYLRTLLDSDALDDRGSDDERVDLSRVIPFILLHFGVLLVFYSGVSAAALGLCLGSYLLRMFAITAFYHRYFSHKTFKTGRLTQFVFAFVGCCAVQRGPLWWAAHHRNHHRHSDREEDAHSPVQRSFWWSHMGWFLCRKNFPTDKGLVRDWMKYPELVWLNRFDWIAPVFYALFMWGLGYFCSALFPALGLSVSQALVWGFLVSTVLLYHGTFVINSLAHKFGSRPFETRDHSRNNGWLALITLGEGWHNNHHFYPNSVRQGFRPWEFDPSYWILCMMRSVGLVYDFRPIPSSVQQQIKDNK